MTSHMTVEDLKIFCREKKPVYWHPEWVKVREYIGEDFFGGENNRIYIIKLWEDKDYPDIVGVSYIHNKKPGYIAIKRDGKAMSKELDYPVFSRKAIDKCQSSK